MIVTVTANAAIDRTALVDDVRFDTVLRPAQLIALPGGKGINVARVARALGASVVTTGFAGGHAGRWLLERLEAEGLHPRFVEIGGESRTTYTTTDTRRSVIVSEAGPEISEEDAERLTGMLDAILATADKPIVALSGAMPAGATQGLTRRLVEGCGRRGATVILDTNGPPLVEGVQAGPDIVKVNADEAVEAGFGAGAPDGADWPARDLALARSLRAAGAATAIVTAGSRGAVAVDAAGEWVVEAHKVTVVSAVGSGDAFTAGLAVERERGGTLDAALASGAAAGAANAAVAGAGMIDPELHRRIGAMMRATRA